MYSLYGYTQDVFYKSIESIFPEIDRAAYRLCFMFSDNSSSDFCTPVACQLGRYIDNRQPPEVTACQIINAIPKDTSHFQSVFSSGNGFINCRISQSFFNSFLDNESNNQMSPVSGNEIDIKEDLQIILRLERLLDYAINTVKYDLDAANADCSVLSCNEEKKLLSILALEDFPFFKDGKSLFIRKLLQAATLMYRKIPIICKDDFQSVMRVRLIRAVMRRVDKACIR